MILHYTLSDSKSLLFPITLFSSLADLINAGVWMIFARPPISNSFRTFKKVSGIVPSAPTKIGITDTVFHSFLVL